jgi:hypothetical protein
MTATTDEAVASAGSNVMAIQAAARLRSIKAIWGDS